MSIPKTPITADSATKPDWGTDKNAKTDATSNKESKKSKSSTKKKTKKDAKVDVTVVKQPVIVDDLSPVVVDPMVAELLGGVAQVEDLSVSDQQTEVPVQLLRQVAVRMPQKKAGKASQTADVEIVTKVEDVDPLGVFEIATHKEMGAAPRGINAMNVALMDLANKHTQKDVGSDVSKEAYQFAQKYIVPTYYRILKSTGQLGNVQVVQDHDGGSGQMNFSENSDDSQSDDPNGWGAPLDGDASDMPSGLSGINVMAFVQYVLQNEYLGNQKTLLLFAQKVKGYNKLREIYRNQLQYLYKKQSDLASNSDSSWPPGTVSSTSYYQVPFIDSGSGGPSIQSSVPISTKAQLSNQISMLNDTVNDIGGNADAANLDLQNLAQKQTQFVSVQSNLSKMVHDTAMSEIRNISGS